MRIVVMTGAGMSQESGIKTFRDSNGLWENHAVEEVATPEGFRRNPSLVLEFYNQRRRQLMEVEPNAGHLALKRLEEKHTVHIVTQNVDNLHERAGSTDILHLHGSLVQVRSTKDERLVYDWEEDLNLGDTCEKGSQLRPHIVWFGEEVPLLMKAAALTQQADVVIIIGTSMQVYPAASLVEYAPSQAKVFYIDPYPAINTSLSRRNHLEVMETTAAVGVPALVEQLLKD